MVSMPFKLLKAYQQGIYRAFCNDDVDFLKFLDYRRGISVPSGEDEENAVFQHSSPHLGLVVFDYACIHNF